MKEALAALERELVLILGAELAHLITNKIRAQQKETKTP